MSFEVMIKWRAPPSEKRNTLDSHLDSHLDSLDKEQTELSKIPLHPPVTLRTGIFTVDAYSNFWEMTKIKDRKKMKIKEWAKREKR